MIESSGFVGARKRSRSALDDLLEQLDMRRVLESPRHLVPESPCSEGRRVRGPARLALSTSTPCTPPKLGVHGKEDGWRTPVRAEGKQEGLRLMENVSTPANCAPLDESNMVLPSSQDEGLEEVLQAQAAAEWSLAPACPSPRGLETRAETDPRPAKDTLCMHAWEVNDLGQESSAARLAKAAKRQPKKLPAVLLGESRAPGLCPLPLVPCARASVAANCSAPTTQDPCVELPSPGRQADCALDASGGRPRSPAHRPAADAAAGLLDTNITPSHQQTHPASSHLQAYLPQHIAAAFALGHSLLPWQVECLAQPGVLSAGRGLVLSAPTSAGKSLVAEVLLLRSLLRDRCMRHCLLVRGLEEQCVG